MTAIVVHLHVVSSYFYAPVAELSNWDREVWYTMHNAFTILSFTGDKNANPGLLIYLKNKP